MADVWSDLVGTIKTVFRVGFSKAVIDAGGLSAERVYELPDQSGTVALLDDIGTHLKRQVPAETPDGVRVSFTLPHTPIPGTEDVFVEGVFMDDGDYTLSGDTLTFLIAPTGKIRANYNI